jgi:TRAP-type transport system periplasmic protein
MRRFWSITLVLICLVVSATPATAITIKLASVAPEQSPWGIALNRMAAEWEQITDGAVRVIVYHNSMAGEEADVLRKIRIGQLHAAVLTSSGMKNVVPEVFSLSIPFLLRSVDELTCALEGIAPDLEELFRQQRLHVLAWSRAGWIHFFSREPVETPDDLRAQRLGVDPNDEELFQAFQVMGYRPVPMPLPEVVTSLNSGLIDAFYSSPLAAAGFQSFALAPNMLDIRVAPFLGSIVVSDAAWRRVPAQYRDDLVDVARRVSAEIDEEVERLESEATETMKRYGLHVTEYSRDLEQLWIDDVSQREEALLDVFDPEMTLRVRRLLDEYRR